MFHTESDFLFEFFALLKNPKLLALVCSMSSRLPEVLQLWSIERMTACMLHLYFWVFLSWFMHALFTSCSPVLAQHASSKFHVPLMTPGGCGQWVQACRLSGRVSEWWKPCGMKRRLTKLSHCHALTPHHMSRHSRPRYLSIYAGVCFGCCCDWNPWHPVARKASPGPKLDLGGKRKARHRDFQTDETPITTDTTYHLNETHNSFL